MNKHINIEYMAGFFDGEGNIQIGKNRFIPRSKSPAYGLAISIGNANREVVELFASELGGTVRMRLTATGREYYHWGISGEKALYFLNNIYPFSVVKSKEIEIAQKFMGLPKVDRGHRGHTVPQEITEAREQCMQELQKLHLKGHSHNN